LPCINSKRKHLLVVIDSFTKFVKLFPVNSTSTREVIASLNKYFGQVERVNRVLTPMLGKLSNPINQAFSAF